MAIIKNKTEPKTTSVNKGEEIWEPLYILEGVCNGAVVMENTFEITQKIKNRTTIQYSYSTSRYVSKIIEIRILRRYLHTHVHCSIIHSNQDVEIT